MPDSTRSKLASPKSWTLLLLVIATLGLGLVFAPGLLKRDIVTSPTWVAGLPREKLTSESCISCHQKEGDQWRSSHHQLANRLVDPENPNSLFSAATAKQNPKMVIGVAPLIQLLIETQSGTFQAHDLAWDPAKQEWFNVFGNEERKPGEWGHWTGQSMNWNSSCARCHMTAFNKDFDESKNTYNSSWVEQGIGCVQCHGAMTGHEQNRGKHSVDRESAEQTCATCHARAEDLTQSAAPGSKFEDHFRLQLVTDPNIYHPDGQNISENFEWGSFRHSKMSAAGVTCLDCHNAHTGKLVLPFANNSLCMQCHMPGNQRKAPEINPSAHSFHKEDSPGNRCVSCHMTEKTYMQRHQRKDHGFIIPDPLLHKELGIPDACSSCHADKSVDWSIKYWDKRYAASGKAAPRRARTRAVARAFAGDTAAVTDLLKFLNEEKSSGWRASLLTLADQLAPGSETVVQAATKLRNDPDPLVRAAAIRALSAHEASRELVREALRDPIRLVRLDAALALSAELKVGSESREELDQYLNAAIENPIALYRRGQERFQRGQREEGIADLKKSIALDPLSSPLYEALGFMLNSIGQSAEAAKQFEKAATLNPNDPRTPYLAALAWNEAGDLKQSEKQFRESLKRDSSQARVWYNLGLLLNQTGRKGEAIKVLKAAETLAPGNEDILTAISAIESKT